MIGKLIDTKATLLKWYEANKEPVIIMSAVFIWSWLCFALGAWIF